MNVDNMWPLLLSCLPVGLLNTSVHGRSCGLVMASVLLQRITELCGGACDEKSPNLFKVGPVGSSVPPTSSSFLPRLQKGLIEAAEWGH